MKTLKFILFALLLIGFTTNSYAVVTKSKEHKKVVGTPLDGGLLSILGAAGISYYLIRKKKKVSE